MKFIAELRYKTAQSEIIDLKGQSEADAVLEVSRILKRDRTITSVRLLSILYSQDIDCSLLKGD